MGQSITITGERGGWGAYLARPAAPSTATVVVLHEVFGVNADIRQTCDDIAAQGFLALAPDLFWRQEPGVDLDVTSLADWNKGLALYTAFDRETGAGDIVATVEAARRLDGADGRVALLGYCLGALMAFLTTARVPVDAAVAFHGADTERYLAEASAISAPLLMHLAEEDEFMTPAARAEIARALQPLKDASVYSYPGCHHAFSRHGGRHYDAAAAALANARTRAFLHTHLG